jgi:hypothetical protein
MGDLRAFTHFVYDAPLRLYEPEPSGPLWCPSGRLLVEHAEELARWVSQQITPDTIRYGISLLEDAYWELYDRETDAHRRDERHADHPCLHEALRVSRKALSNLKFQGRIQDFLPGPAVRPAPAPRVIDADEPFAELPGILDEGAQDWGGSPAAAG